MRDPGEAISTVLAPALPGCVTVGDTVEEGPGHVAALRGLGELGQGQGLLAPGLHWLDLENRARVPHPSTMRKIAGALGVEIAAVDEFRDDDHSSAD